MEPIRVLYLDHVTHLSGAEQSLFDLVVGLAGGPIEPVVVLPEDGPLAQQLRGAGVLVRNVKMSKRLLETSRTTLRTRPFVAVLRLFSFLAVGIRLRRIIREVRPQVIHTNTLKAHLMAILPAKLSRVPLVWHMRDILPSGMMRRAFLLCARFPDRIVVISRAVAVSMGRNKTVYRKLRLIPNGIRIDTFGDRDEGAALRGEIGATSKDTVIGIVGRIAPWKGQDVFVHAAAMIAERHPKARFAIVGAPMFGDDDFQHDLASLVYQYELDGRVMFAGWRSAQEAMSAIDIVVHASTEPEPFGRTIVEAMAAGRPVVAAAGGAVGEILPPNAGFIVPPARPEILADALENLLEDRRLREEMGANGKEAATRFFDVRRTISAVGSVYAELGREYAKATAARRRRSGLLSVIKKIRKPRLSQRPSQRPGVDRMQAMRGRPAATQQNRRPLNADRRPPVLRPQTPDAIPAGRPQRRVPVREESVGSGPVRRTARIQIDLDAPDAFVEEPRRPQRRVEAPVSFQGGHVLRRPPVLDDPGFAEHEVSFDDDIEEPVKPVRRPAKPGVQWFDDNSRPSGTTPVKSSAAVAVDEPSESVVDEPPADEPATDEPVTDRRKPALLRAITGALPFKRPFSNVPASTGSAAPQLEPEEDLEPAPRPVAVAVAAAAPLALVKPIAVAPATVAMPARLPSPVVVSARVAVPAAVVAPARVAASVPVAVPRPVPVVRPAPQTTPALAPTSKPVYELLKRVVDVVIACVVLIVGSPLWLLTAFAIKMDSSGRVLFKGTVWGKDCKPFTYYKFRSMGADGDHDGHREFIQSYVQTGAGVTHGDKTIFKYVGDPRITRVGRLIRKLSIDEIPQLVNVIKGDMSLVGPRPPLEYEYELYDDAAKQRLAVRPGMTGLQQTYARHSAAFQEKVEMDLAYIRDRSLLLDLTILIKTIPAAFKGE